LLGLKGTFSELEVCRFSGSVHKRRCAWKAARGDLYTTVAIGYRRKR